MGPATATIRRVVGGAAANPPRHHACCPLGPTSADLSAVPRRRPLAHKSRSHVAGAPPAGQQVHTRAVTVTRQMSPSGSVPRAGPHHKRSLGRRPPCEVAPLPRAPPGQQGQGRPGRGTLDGTQSVGATARPGAAGHHVGLRWEVVSRVLAATTSRTPGTSKTEVLRSDTRFDDMLQLSCGCPHHLSSNHKLNSEQHVNKCRKSLSTRHTLGASLSIHEVAESHSLQLMSAGMYPNVVEQRARPLGRHRHTRPLLAGVQR
ncbi:hypothetical protein E2C01_050363 [Portunus trituberculatus]|uniref:Uncharacterized protein n=1 Tax=Portunus trituberculatus TaxID=210409 RepID=A0A5B7GGA5_PORTR|nr:hypothetical protein [Portunus trituberculatus]